MDAHRPEIDDEIDLSTIQRVRSGNSDSFSEIVSRYTPMLYSLAFRMLGADDESAREAVQEIFLKAYRSLASFDASRRFFPWLYTIGVNHLRSLRRAGAVRRPRVVPLESVAGAGVAEDGPGPDELAVSREGERLAQRAVDSLPQRLREVFLLRHVEGLSTEEVAKILGVPESTVRTWLFRARQRLKSLLLDSGWE